MQLTITPAEDGCLDYRSTLLRVELQRHLHALDRQRVRSDGRLTLCSCCKKAFVNNGTWKPLEQVAASLRLFASETPPQLLYSICPDCAELGQERGSNGHVA